MKTFLATASHNIQFSLSRHSCTLSHLRELKEIFKYVNKNIQARLKGIWYSKSSSLIMYVLSDIIKHMTAIPVKQIAETLIHKDSRQFEDFLDETSRVLPLNASVPISNPLSGGQCNLILVSPSAIGYPDSV